MFRECSGGSRGGLPCVEDADCGGAACVFTTCYGGTNDRLTCTADSDCPGGECGPGLFELRDRLSDGGIGPVVISRTAGGGGGSFAAGIVGPRTPGASGVCDSWPNEGQVCPPADCTPGQCVDYRVEAQTPVPLEGIAETTDLLVFTVDEAAAGVDINGDGDIEDSVLEARDRATGEELSVWTTGGTVRIHQPPFSFPSVVAEDNVLALLYLDTFAGDCGPPLICDSNQDGDYFDTFLAVFRKNPGDVDSLSQHQVVDASPEIDEGSLAVSEGRVFFHVSEWMDAQQQNEKVSVDSAGNEGSGGVVNPVISSDGRFVAFTSPAFDFVAGDTNGVNDIFVHDRSTGVTERVSVDSLGNESNGDSYNAGISDDGRYISFESLATNLVAGDTNGVSDIFVHDRDYDDDGIFDEPVFSNP